MRLEALFFDFDGLIVDTESICFLAWAELYAEIGLELDPATYVACIGTAGAEAITADLARQSGFAVDPAIITRVDARQDQLALELDARPGIRSLIEEADAAGVSRAIVSSGRRPWIDRILDSVSLTDGWSAVVCADGDDERAKPNPHLYLEALAGVGVPPHAALALEDSPNGVRAAKEAGIFCVAVPCAMTSSLDLSEADLRLTSLSGVTLGALDLAPSEWVRAPGERSTEGP